MASNTLTKNPFPQLGTEEVLKYKTPVIGWEEEIERIAKLLVDNVGHQSILIKIIGKYGYGKSKFLRAISEKVLEINDNFVVEEIRIDRETDFGREIKEIVKRIPSSKNILLKVDEAQQIFTEEELKDTENISNIINKIPFLNDLRAFTDGKLIPGEQTRIGILLAVHPITDFFISKRTDVEDRIRVETITLKDLTYYQVEAIAREYLRLAGYDPDTIFSPEVYYCAYALTYFIENKTHNSPAGVPRTYLQLLFKLFEIIKDEKINPPLDYLDLENILIYGNPPLIFSTEKSSSKTKAYISTDIKELKVLLNREKFDEIKSGFIDKLEGFVSYMIFNPTWINVKKLNGKFGPLGLRINELSNRSEFDVREAIQIDKNSFRKFKRINFELIELNKLVENLSDNVFVEESVEEIFKDGKPYYLIFLDEFSNEEKDKIKEYLKKYLTDPNRNKEGINLSFEKFVRLSGEYLRTFYSFHTKTTQYSTSELYNYLSMDISKKIEKIEKTIKQVLKRTEKLPNSFINYYFSDNFSIISGVSYNIACVVYPKDLFEFPNDFATSVVSLAEDSSIDIIVVLLDPYVNPESIQESFNDLLNDSEIRGMKNRLFLYQLSRKELSEVLRGNSAPIEEVLKQSTYPFIKEAIDKQLSVPLIGLQEKYNNRLEDLLNLFSEDVRESIDYEFQKMIKGKANKETKSQTFQKAKFTGLDDLALSTLNQFFEINEKGVIVGEKLSKLEKFILEKFKDEEYNKEEFQKLLERYFHTKGRINPIVLGLKLLNTRGLVIEKNEKILLQTKYKTIKTIKDLKSKLKQLPNDLTLETKIKVNNLLERCNFLEFLLDDINEDDFVESRKLRVAIYQVSSLENEFKNILIVKGTDKYNILYNKIYTLKNKIDEINDTFSYHGLNTELAISNWIESIAKSRLSQTTEGYFEENDNEYDLEDVEQIEITEEENSEYYPSKISTQQLKLLISKSYDLIKQIINNNKNIPDYIDPIQYIVLNMEIEYLIEKISDIRRHFLTFVELKNIKEKIDENKELYEVIPLIQSISEKTFDILLQKSKLQINDFAINQEIFNYQQIVEYSPYIIEPYEEILRKSFSILVQQNDIQASSSNFLNMVKDFLELSEFQLNNAEFLKQYCDLLINLNREEYIQHEFYLASRINYPVEKLIRELDILNDEEINSLIKKGYLIRTTTIIEKGKNGKIVADKKINYELISPTESPLVRGFKEDKKIHLSSSPEFQLKDKKDDVFKNQLKSYSPNKEKLWIAPLNHPEINYNPRIIKIIMDDGREHDAIVIGDLRKNQDAEKIKGFDDLIVNINGEQICLTFVSALNSEKINQSIFKLIEGKIDKVVNTIDFIEKLSKRDDLFDTFLEPVYSKNITPDILSELGLHNKKELEEIYDYIKENHEELEQRYPGLTFAFKTIAENWGVDL